MTPRQIRSVLAVHQHGSIQKAARLLHLAPSSISAQLKELSHELGVDLFVSVGRNIILSDVGRSLLPSMQTFVAQEESIREQALQACESLSGSLTLFAPSSMCIYRLPGLIEEMQLIAPNLEVLLTHEPFDYEQALLDGDIDAAIIIPEADTATDNPALKPWRYQRLYQEDVIYVCHPKRVQKRSMTVEELTQHPIISTEPACTYRRRAEQHFGQTGHSFEPRQSFSNVEVVKRCLLTNMGIGLLPRCVVDAELQSGQLMEQTVEGTPYPFASYLIALPHSSGSARLTALWQIAQGL